MTTLTQLRDRVKLQLGGKSNIDSHIDTKINDAIYQLIMEVKPQEMWTEVTLKTNTTTATPEYEFNSSTATVWGTAQDTATTDVMALLMVRDDTDDVELRRGGIRDYNRVRQDVTDASSTGDPRSWTRLANKLVLYNLIPDTSARTLTVTYLKRPTELSSDSDTFPLNREWEHPVELLAASYVWSVLNNPTMAGAKLSQYRDKLVMMDKPESLEDEAPEAQLIPLSNLVR